MVIEKDGIYLERRMNAVRSISDELVSYTLQTSMLFRFAATVGTKHFYNVYNQNE